MVEGLWLMAIGMATVFAFLGVMVLTMQGSAAFFDSYGHLFPEPEPPPKRVPEATVPIEIAVVLAAVAHHRGI